MKGEGDQGSRGTGVRMEGRSASGVEWCSGGSLHIPPGLALLQQMGLPSLQ